MKRFATHRELVKWCAQGKGEWMHRPSNSGTVYTIYKYNEGEADCCITEHAITKQRIVVRRWNSMEWNAPTKECLYDNAKGTEIYEH